MEQHTQAEPIIEVQDLVVAFDDRIILNDISFKVGAGEIFMIIGGSGCGKTTLLKHMVGLNLPAAGRVTIDGIDITAGDSAQFQEVLKKIGILFQGGALFGSMTLAENIALPIVTYTGLPRPAVDRMVRMKLCIVDLGNYANFFPSEISGGMKKRAALARALALNPKILFLDEPTAGLDPITAAEIDQLIVKLNRILGTTMIIVTHDLDSIMNIADKIIMLEKTSRGIIAQGDPRRLKQENRNPVVQRFFNRQAAKP